MEEYCPEYGCSVGHREVDGLPLVTLKGACDILLASAARSIVQGLLGTGKRTILISMSEVLFVSPESYHLFNECCRDISDAGGHLVLIGAATAIREEFRKASVSPGCLVASSTLKEALSVAKKLGSS